LGVHQFENENEIMSSEILKKCPKKGKTHSHFEEDRQIENGFVLNENEFGEVQSREDQSRWIGPDGSILPGSSSLDCSSLDRS
jgi:hypothetical protein